MPCSGPIGTFATERDVQPAGNLREISSNANVSIKGLNMVVRKAALQVEGKP